MLFSLLTMVVAVPSAIKVFNWTATLYKGSIDFQPPLLYALTFIFLFSIGGLTGATRHSPRTARMPTPSRPLQSRFFPHRHTRPFCPPSKSWPLLKAPTASCGHISCRTFGKLVQPLFSPTLNRNSILCSRHWLTCNLRCTWQSDNCILSAVPP